MKLLYLNSIFHCSCYPWNSSNSYSLTWNADKLQMFTKTSHKHPSKKSTSSVLHLSSCISSLTHWLKKTSQCLVNHREEYCKACPVPVKLYILCKQTNKQKKAKKRKLCSKKRSWEPITFKPLRSMMPRIKVWCRNQYFMVAQR